MPITRILFILIIFFFYNNQEVAAQQQSHNLDIFCKAYTLSYFFNPPTFQSKTDVYRYALSKLPKLVNSDDPEKICQNLKELFSGILPQAEFIITKNPDSLKNRVLRRLRTSEHTEYSYLEHRGAGINKKKLPLLYQIFLGKVWYTTPKFIQSKDIDTSFIHVEKLRDGLYIVLPLFTPNGQKIDSNIDKPQKVNLKNTGTEDLNARILIFAEMWGVMRHFYTYQDFISEKEWNIKLTQGIEELLNTTNKKEFEIVLLRFLSSFHDGHCGLGKFHNKSFSNKTSTFWISELENKFVITRTNENYIPKEVLDIGDEIISINDTAVVEWIQRGKQIAAFASLENDKASSANFYLSNYYYQDSMKVSIMKYKSNERKEYFVKMTTKNSFPIKEKPAIRELDNQLYYFDLTEISYKDFKPYLERLKNARGIIFDIRGYPNYNAEKTFLTHFVKDTIQCIPIFFPKIINPNYVNVNYQKEQWSVYPSSYQIEAPLIVLTNSNCMSYGETILEMIKFYKIATIIGSNTASTNGDANFYRLPCNYLFTYTQAKILQRDGTPYMGVGIKPDIEINKNHIKDFVEGKDPVFEKAIEYILNKPQEDTNDNK